MNGVLGMATLLSQTQLSKEQSEYVATVQASGEHLLTVLNDILDYSKQESGALELEATEVDLYQTLEQAVELSFRKEHCLELLLDVQHPDDQMDLHSHVDVLDAAAAKGCALSNMVEQPLPAPLPQLIVADVTRLRQIIVNIISNACKFTPDGGSIRISVGCSNRLAAAVGAAPRAPLSYAALEALVQNGDVSRDYWNRFHNYTAPAPGTATVSGAVGGAATATAAAADSGLAPADEAHRHTQFLEVQMSVADSGIGIPRAKIHKLFKAFSQLDASTTREYGGTGARLDTTLRNVRRTNIACRPRTRALTVCFSCFSFFFFFCFFIHFLLSLQSCTLCRIGPGHLCQAGAADGWTDVVRERRGPWRDVQFHADHARRRQVAAAAARASQRRGRHQWRAP